MRKIIEWCYVSTDGIFEDPIRMGIGEYWDEAYLRDALGLFEACDAIFFGRCTYEIFAKIWSGNHGHPYAAAPQCYPKVCFLLESGDSRVE
jgi:hypothetical protein